jgi:hypothetical protein
LRRTEIDQLASGPGVVALDARWGVARPTGEAGVSPTPHDSASLVDPTAGVAPHATSSAPRDASLVELAVVAPRAGRFEIQLGYITRELPWQVGYTITTTARRDRAVVRGVLAIRNTAGLALPGARVRVVDAELGASVHRAGELLAARYRGTPPPSTAVAFDAGVVDLVDGETAIALLAGDPPRPLRSVLVYDPVGTELDRASAAPAIDRELGAGGASPRVLESLEVPRDRAAGRGLPGGPVRLLEQRADGTTALLGEARLFDERTRAAAVDTIALGTADGVTGRRERREYTYDEPRKRIAEDFAISIDNARSYSVEVVVREHLYRGQNWTLAYPIGGGAHGASKEGPQQISMRVVVPPAGQARLLYVVVYTWP